MTRPTYRFLALFAVFGMAAHAARAAEPSTDPLRLVPDAANLVVKVEQPTKLVDILRGFASMKELQGINAYREYYNSTNYVRFLQLVAYAEKQLGRPWPELVDALAGGGIVVAAKVGEGDNAPAMLVVQGKDPAMMKKFHEVFVQVIEQELARQESKQALKKGMHKGYEVIQIGDDFYAATLDSAFVVSNKKKGMEAAFDLHTGKSTKSIAGSKLLLEGRQLVAANPLVWAWLDLEPVKKSEQAKKTLEIPAADPIQYIAVGPYFDLVRRSPFVVADLHIEEKTSHPVIAIRAPKGLDGMHEGLAMFIPPEGEHAALPLLEPKGVLFSTSYYLSMKGFWNLRDKLFIASVVKEFEDGDKKTGAVLLGTRISTLLNLTGDRQRIVVSQQYETGYQTKPQNRIPAFAWIVELSDPEKFQKAAEPPLRSLGLLGSFGADMSLVEETHKGVKIVGYRFKENAKNKAINNGILFNLTPCFFRIGNQFVLASSLELGRELADTLEFESRAGAIPNLKPAVSRSQFYWKGLGIYLETIRDQLITQSIFAEGSSPEAAKEQVKLGLQLLEKLGSIEACEQFEKNRFSYEFELKIPTKTTAARQE